MKTAALFCAAAVLTAGSSVNRLRPPLWNDRDDQPIAKPAQQKVSELYAIVYNSWVRHLRCDAAADPHDRGSLNVNAWDEVPDSSWFTNRIGRRLMSFGELCESLAGTPPQPGKWTVERNLQVGYTPKLRVRDGSGRRYWTKFDLPAAPERNSGAERISTLILHAAGYNVPLNCVLRFRPGDLELAQDAQFTDELNRRRPMTPADLKAALALLKPDAQGLYRGVASYLLEGEDIGEWKYYGRRADDPNDIIPHQLRRELRGLRVIAAWINHADTGDKNTKDMYVATNGEQTGFVRHHLLDFGSTLGSGDYTNGPFRVGHEYLFDGSAIGKTLISFGAWRRPWEERGVIRYPEVGYFDAALFEPGSWKGNYPNLAFVRMDDGDAYWAAKIVTAFPDTLIEQIVASAGYSRPEVSRYVADTLRQRRDRIGRWAFGRVSAIEEFSLVNGQLTFRDLAVERGYAEGAARRYRWWSDGRAAQACTSEGCAVPAFLPGGTADRFGRVLSGRVFVQASSADRWGAPVEVFIGRTSAGGAAEVLGWRHAPKQED